MRAQQEDRLFENIQKHPLPGCNELNKLLGYETTATNEEKPDHTAIYNWLSDYTQIEKTLNIRVNQINREYFFKVGLRKKAHNAHLTLINNAINSELENIKQAINLHLPCPAQQPAPKAPSLSRRIGFTSYAIILGFLEATGGIAAMYTFIQYLCTSLSLKFISPIASIMSLVFGLISASVAAVFDIYAVANAMGVPYLTASKQLSTLIEQAHQLIDLNKQIKKGFESIKDALLDPSFNTGIHFDSNERYLALRQQLENITQIQANVSTRINRYNDEVEASRFKRKLYQFIWVLFASPIYAGIVVIGANAVLATLPSLGFPPAGLVFAALFALTWVMVELYRFWSFERHHMVLGIDSLIFGSPSDKLTELLEKRDSMENELTLNQKDLALLGGRFFQAPPQHGEPSPTAAALNTPA